MKLLIFVLALSCAIVYTSADLWKPEPLPTDPILSHNPRSRDQAEKDFSVTDGFRFRREAEPQGGSINFQGTQPLSGPNRQPSWDLNANRNIYNNGRTTADVYGGLNKVPGQRVQPHVGVQAERNFGNNGFIRGHTQIQPRPGGHGLSPSVGVTGGFRFRREAEPQGGSINFQGTQPLSGPNRQPSWDLNANRNIYNNGRTTADVYGGLNKVPGQRVQPHVGVQAERNFGNNGFIRGHTQFQPRPGGHGLSPSVGVTGGFRFRRAAEDADEAVSAEE
ncbi:Hymenoptaecin [Formica fusca]